MHVILSSFIFGMLIISHAIPLLFVVDQGRTGESEGNGKHRLTRKRQSEKQ